LIDTVLCAVNSWTPFYDREHAAFIDIIYHRSV